MTTTTVADSIAYGGDYYADPAGVAHIRDVLEDQHGRLVPMECGLALQERAEVVPSRDDPACPHCTLAVNHWMALAEDGRRTWGK